MASEVKSEQTATEANSPESSSEQFRSGLHLNQSWGQTTKDLKSALDTWDLISKECQGPSPDEQMLKDMQALLKKLQGKLKELS